MSKGITKVRQLTKAVLSLANIEKLYTKWEGVVRILASVVAIFLGFVGYLREDIINVQDNFVLVINCLYKSLQLITIQMPSSASENLPWELQVARFAVPITAAWLSIGTYFDHVRKPLNFISALRSKKHLILVGSGPRLEEVAKQAAESDYKIVYISDNEKNDSIAIMEAYDISVIVGDYKCAKTFRRARLDRAQAIIVMTGDNISNINISALARNMILAVKSKQSPHLTIIVEIEGSDMRSILCASFQKNREKRVEYRLFDAADNIARSLTSQLAYLVHRRAQPVIFVVGCDIVSEAIIIKLIRNCPAETRILVCGPSAIQMEESIKARYSMINNLPKVEFIDAALGEKLFATQAMQDRIASSSLSVAIISGAGLGDRDDEQNLCSAIAIRKFTRDHALATIPIFVRLRRGPEALDAFRLMRGELIDTSRIFSFGSIDDECSLDNILRDNLDNMARRSHEGYRLSVKPGPSSLPWEDLDETFRNACRNQVDHTSYKLASIHIRACSDKEDGKDFQFTSREIDIMARMEHSRWIIDRLLDGWAFGPNKDIMKKTSPSLVSYDNLNKDMQNYNQEVILNLRDTLLLSGHALMREHYIGIPKIYCAPVLINEITRLVKLKASEGLYPIILLILDGDEALNFGMAMIECDIEFNLFLTQSEPVLFSSLEGDALARLLDRAVSVELVEGDVNSHVSKFADEVIFEL